MFTAGTTLKLIPQGGGSPIAASSVTDGGQQYALRQFNLTGAAAGTYDLQAVAGTQTATDAGAFTVTTGTPGQLVVHMSEPSAHQAGPNRHRDDRLHATPAAPTSRPRSSS